MSTIPFRVTMGIHDHQSTCVCEGGHDGSGAAPWKRSWVRRALIFPFVLPIRVYQFTLSPFIGNQCRFYPTCSRYAIEAYELHGPIRGTLLTVWRLCRCHPFGGHGYDPPPLPREK